MYKRVMEKLQNTDQKMIIKETTSKVTVLQERKWLGYNPDVVCFLLALNLEIRDRDLKSQCLETRILIQYQKDYENTIASLREEVKTLKSKYAQELSTFNNRLQDKDQCIQQHSQLLIELQNNKELEIKSQEKIFQDKIQEIERAMEQKLENLKHQHQEVQRKQISSQNELSTKFNKIFEQNIELKEQLKHKENEITLWKQNLESINNSLMMMDKNQMQQNYDFQLEQNKNLLKKQEQLEIILSYVSTQIQILDLKDSKNYQIIKDLEDEKIKKLAQIGDLQNSISVKNEEIDKFKQVEKQLNEEIDRLKKLLNLLQDNVSLKTQSDQKQMSQLAIKEDINQILRKLTDLEVQIREKNKFEQEKALEELNVIHNSVAKCKYYQIYTLIK
ncbi:hypothetical protein pb186bvf_008785 [Paramecium bursaria]